MISDSDIYNTSSIWYQKMCQLREDCKRILPPTYHKHHWIPCIAVAIYYNIPRTADYRTEADKRYPQQHLILSPTAHLLMHYYAWKAAWSTYAGAFQHAYEALYRQYGSWSDTYTDQLNKANGKAPKGTVGVQIQIPKGIYTVAQARATCKMMYPAFKLMMPWPKFQSAFMSQWKSQFGKSKKPAEWKGFTKKRI